MRRQESLSIAPEVTEPLCPRCVERQGLCRVHARSVLPQLAQPGWVRLIGKQAAKKEKPQAESPAARKARLRKERKAERRQARLRAARTAELCVLVSQLPKAA